ncbi:MAG: lysophospholipid acyltransferase family protein [Deltaproteobacteria bacterium]|nr:lysophospholipid acyltransferase family protein [Deltaproteobacteria bacterium]
MFYRLLVRLSRLVGLWLVRVSAAIIAAGYFVLLPGRRRASVTFYRALFPERSPRFALACAWRQYQDFARLYTERLEIERRADIRFESEGEEPLAEVRAAGLGAILLMSHFGRWEIGARLFGKRHPGLTLVMGGLGAGGARGGVDEALRLAGVDVVTVADGQGQPVDILQAVQGLRKGGVVSLAADRAYGDARMLYLPFLGQRVAVTAAPFALALASHAPLFIVFAVKLGPRHYRFTCDPPMLLRAPTREDREKVMEQAATRYLQRLHEMARAHPEQWQTFGEFLVPSPHEQPPVPSPRAAGRGLG